MLRLTDWLPRPFFILGLTPCRPQGGQDIMSMMGQLMNVEVNWLISSSFFYTGVDVQAAGRARHHVHDGTAHECWVDWLISASFFLFWCWRAGRREGRTSCPWWVSSWMLRLTDWLACSFFILVLTCRPQGGQDIMSMMGQLMNVGLTDWLARPIFLSGVDVQAAGWAGHHVHDGAAH